MTTNPSQQIGEALLDALLSVGWSHTNELRIAKTEGVFEVRLAEIGADDEGVVTDSTHRLTALLNGNE